jgi:hypothetical protein
MVAVETDVRKSKSYGTVSAVKALNVDTSEEMSTSDKDFTQFEKKQSIPYELDQGVVASTFSGPRSLIS